MASDQLAAPTWPEIRGLLRRLLPAGQRTADLADEPEDSAGHGEQGPGRELPLTIQSLYRAIFCLRSSTDAARVIAHLAALIRCPLGELGADSPLRSVLFRHECCYLLGQLGAAVEVPSGTPAEGRPDPLALKRAVYECLADVLRDEREHEVTRHEAAEGLAAVWAFNSEDGGAAARKAEVLCLLEKYAHGAPEKTGGIPAGGPALAETCRLAVQGLERDRTKMCACQYRSFDPAVGEPGATEADVPRLRQQLMDVEAPLYSRYVAMFTLRNLATPPCVGALCESLDTDQSSAVVRHEVAFILGQLESEEATGALARSLAKQEEHPMVRHESAIALGSIGGPVAKESLMRCSDDPEPMVSESCLVALDTAAYWEAWEELERRIQDQG